MSSQQQDIIFAFDDMQKTINDLLDSYFASKQYDESQVPKWINEINEMMMAKLVDTQKPFKYMINTLIMQRKGANTVILHCTYNDTGFDQSCVVSWPKEKSKPELSKDTIQCMVSVYIVSALNSLTYAKNNQL